MKKLTLFEKFDHNKSIIHNFSFLSVLQIFNVVFPLLTYPYLIRILGGESFGLVIFSQSIIGYLTIFVNFGFNISATRSISIHRDNYIKISEIVSCVYTIKFLLLLISFLIVITLISTSPLLISIKILLLLSMWACLHDFIFPIWYFQGIEKMKFITYLTISSKLIVFILILVFITNEEDYILVPLCHGIGSLLIGIASLVIIFNNSKIEFRIYNYKVIKKYFLESLPFFISNLSINIYVNANKIIVGSFLGMHEVALYDIGEKIISVVKIPQSVISQVIFPKISKEKNKTFINKALFLSVIVNIILTCLIFLFVSIILKLFAGEQFLQAKPIIRILALTLPIIAVSNIYGVQYLITFGYNVLFAKAIIISVLFYLTQILFTSIFLEFTLIKIATITLFTEIFVATIMLIYYKKIKNEKTI